MRILKSQMHPFFSKNLKLCLTSIIHASFSNLSHINLGNSNQTRMGRNLYFYEKRSKHNVRFVYHAKNKRDRQASIYHFARSTSNMKILKNLS